jgi:hypothetical protein
MKLVQLLIGDYEYEIIQKIFENEKDFMPMDEKDKVLIQAMRAIISPNNLVEENIGGEETETLSVKKVVEPENKEIDSNTKIKVE